MDAITAAACFFFSLADLIITHYGFCRFPSSQLTSAAFWESLNVLTKAVAARLCFTCNLSFPLKQRGGALPKTKQKYTHSHTTSVLHQNRNSLAWNINLPRKRHRESETSSNLMQEKTAIWLGCVNLKRGEGRDLFSLSFYIYPFLPPPVNADH